ncbi:hypothetical protein Tco_0606789 [Tanacetum coccineum]
MATPTDSCKEDDEEEGVEWGCRYGYDNDRLQWLLFRYSRSFMQPQYVDREKSLPRPLPPAAIVEPTKDDNTKAKKSQATKHDGYSALSISAATSNSIRSKHLLTRKDKESVSFIGSYGSRHTELPGAQLFIP